MKQVSGQRGLRFGDAMRSLVEERLPVFLFDVQLETDCITLELAAYL